MSRLTSTRQGFIQVAINLSREWCQGHTIDGAPALGHALKVARKVVEHLPDASPEQIAAVILHDAPYFAPQDVDLDHLLSERLSPTVPTIVRAIEREHQALREGTIPDVIAIDRDALAASAADKVVSIDAITLRSRRSDNPAIYWRVRQPFLNRIPYFMVFSHQAEPHLPIGLGRDLTAAAARAADATSPYR